MRIAIRHETRYRLAEKARRTVQYLRLTPRHDRCQSVVSWSVEGFPDLNTWRDGFGNIVHLACNNEPHDEVVVVVDGVVDTIDTHGVLPLDDGLPPRMFLRETPLTRVTPEIVAFANEHAERGSDGDLAALHRLMGALATKVEYTRGQTDVTTTAAEALALGRGVCQDHAHLFIACARVLGIPCRYVSGYIVDIDPGAASHAWAEAFVDGLGWVSFDAANKRSATDAYVRLAVGYDYASGSPITGRRTGGPGEDLAVSLQVQQLQS